MKRREVLKQIIVVGAGTALLVSCKFESKKVSITLNHLQMNGDHEELVGQLVETIIPVTDIPGAKALNVHHFVIRMIDDCYEAKDQENFVKGLDLLTGIAKEKTGKSFLDCTDAQRIEILTGIDKKEASYPKELLESFPIVKQLTIQGFMTSEYVMTNIQHYEFIPGRFNGCVDVPKLSV